MRQGVNEHNTITLIFKLALVEQIEEGKLTYKQTQTRYDTQGRST